MIRLMYGVTAMISVAAGRITSLGTFQACSPGGMIETAGSACDTLVANSRTSPMPITNSGSAASASVVDRDDVIGGLVAPDGHRARPARSTAGWR